MAFYKICDLCVEMSPTFDELAERAKPFLCEKQEADITIPLPTDKSKQLAEETGLTVPLAEYQLSCLAFCKEILHRGGFVLHASAVKYGDSVYLFSAPSGVGKSTHAHIWERKYGAKIINDDKPAIMIKNGRAIAYGTPWCGSGFVRENESGNVKVLYFIRRAQHNRAFKLDSETKTYLLLESMLRPSDEKSMDSLCEYIDAFVKSCPIMGLECNMLPQAAETAYKSAEEA